MQPELGRKEPASPFVVFSPSERSEIPEDLIAGSRGDSFLAATLSRPERIVDRLLDAEQAQTAVLGSLLVVSSTTFFYALVANVAAQASVMESLRGAVLLPFDLMLAIAASLGPIYAGSILVAARLPLARLVPLLLSAVATGGLLLAALAPVPYFLWHLDSEWAGPLSVVGCFLFSGLAAGARVRKLLRLMADAVVSVRSGELSDGLADGDAGRVAVLARIAMMFLAFTFSLALWGFDVFVH
jgi:hypothetical protein